MTRPGTAEHSRISPRTRGPASPSQGAEKLAAWLAEEVCNRERQAPRVREALLARMREERIEQPRSRDRIGRIIGSALRKSEQALTPARVAGHLGGEVRTRMWALIAAADDDPVNPAAEGGSGAGEAGDALGPEVWAAIRADPGNAPGTGSVA